MNQGRTVFAQLMSLAPHRAFARCVERYRGNARLRSLICWDQFLAMAFAQLTYRESLRDIEVCPGAMPEKLYHMGIRSRVVRSTKGGIKLHTLLDLRGNRPSFLHITEAATHDVQVLDVLIPEAGALYVFDRGYVDFARLFLFTRCAAHFVLRAKTNLKFRRRYSHQVDRSTGVFCDQTILLTVPRSAELYPDPLRRMRFHDPEDGKQITLLALLCHIHGGV